MSDEEHRMIPRARDVLTLTSWEVHYEIQPLKQKHWVYSKTTELPDEATALEMFENFFNKPHYRNVEVVEVVRTVIWQRKEYGAYTTIVTTKGL